MKTVLGVGATHLKVIDGPSAKLLDPMELPVLSLEPERRRPVVRSAKAVSGASSFVSRKHLTCRLQPGDETGQCCAPDGERPRRTWHVEQVLVRDELWDMAKSKLHNARYPRLSVLMNTVLTHSTTSTGQKERSIHH